MVITMFLARYKLSIILIVLILLLSSCEVELTEDYLIENPQSLEQAAIRCEQNDNNNLSECEIVKKVMTDLMMLSDEQSADPEKFGEKILRTQMAGKNKQVKSFLAVIKMTRLE